MQGRHFSAMRQTAGTLAAAFILLQAILGAPRAAFAAAGRVTILSAGIPRTAILIEHHRLKQARRPLIIILRAGRSRGARLHRSTGFDELARSSGAVVVYPQALSGHFADSPGPEAIRDQLFIHDLIARLTAQGLANPGKIFLVGTTTGGMLALRLACDPANHFAGLAVLGASLPLDLAESCKPSRPLPFMMIAGTADPIIPFQGGTALLPHGKIELASVETTLSTFGKAALCGEGKTSTVFLDKDPKDGTHVYLDKLNNCAVPIELVRIEGGGHEMPGLSSEAGTGSGPALSNGDVNSAKLIWDFFRPFRG